MIVSATPANTRNSRRWARTLPPGSSILLSMTAVKGYGDIATAMTYWARALP